jgi:predicted ATPase
MRLRSVLISKYKNLKDFSLGFDGDGSIDIFVGKNGSGKSNFLEALIEIFDHIYNFKPREPDPGFNYEISWDIGGTTTKLGWHDSQLSINGANRKQLGDTPVPANIIVYYSGQNDTVAALIRRNRDTYRRSVRRANVAVSPRFIGIGPGYKTLLVALLLMLPEAAQARQFLCAKLGIEVAGETTSLKLCRPTVAHKSREYDPFNDGQLFWGVKGIAREFLEQLMGCIVGDFTHGSLYDRQSDTYTLDINVAKFRETFAASPAAEAFCQFNALRALKMIEDISIPVRLAANTDITSRAFSDGQFQSVYLFAISELFKDRDSITLLDEPDAFLHPEWQYDFLKQTHAISEQAARTNHILMSSHSAVTLIPDINSKVKFFDLKGGVANCYAIPKKVAIEKLSSNLIKYTEQEQLLSIINAIQIQNKPVLFTEGSIDPIIIKVAWHRLFESELPFIPFYAFSCTYLKQLLSDNRISREMNGLPVFGLFDLDKAFDQWNGLNGDLIEGDLFKGRTKKLDGRNAYAILLPVPTNAAIKAQVIVPATGECFGGDSLCEIEHLFFGDPTTAEFFETEPAPGGGQRVVIKSDAQKERFATEVVPRLPKGYFEVFRPMFELIRSKSGRLH